MLEKSMHKFPGDHQELEEHFTLVNWDQRGAGRKALWGIILGAISLGIVVLVMIIVVVIFLPMKFKA